MKIIYNKFIPLKGYKAINIFGVLFVKNGTKNLSKVDINHEEIHTAQMVETLWVGFYLLYVLEYLIHLIFDKPIIKNYRKSFIKINNDFLNRIYHSVSFEKEAYLNQNNLDYLKTRKHYSWLKYFGIRNY